MAKEKSDIQSLVSDFVSQLTAAVEADMEAKIRSVLGNGLGIIRQSPMKTKSRRVLSPATLKTRRLQGQYLGALRALKGADRARVRALTKEKGVAAALKLAKSITKEK